MINKKLSLIIKAILIIIFVAFSLTTPTKDSFRLGIRLALLVFFVVTFIIELNKYRNNNV
ncbi:hypothetical protein [Ferruginibacter sp.]|nr:hypothetical protein [Ferruginibacter sp.]